MSHLETAFVNLEFSLKLRAYVQDGHIDWQKLDHGFILESEDGRHRINLERQIFETEDDLLTLIENNCTIAFGVAAITLNRSIEENGYQPGKIQKVTNEKDACIAVVYQIRNAFAHDIAEPKWEIRKEALRDKFEINNKLFDLTNLNGKYFHYDHIHGISGFFHLRNFAEEHIIVK